MILNAVAGMLPLVVGLVLMRVQLGALGPKAFGAWSLVTAAVAMMATLDLGLAASLFRFFGVNGDRERAASDRLLNAALLVLIGLLAVLTPLLALGAPVIASALHLEGAPLAQTVAMLRWLGPVLVLPLIVASLAARLQSAGRFGLLAVSVAAGQSTYAAGVLISRGRGMRLTDLVSALVAGQAVTAALAGCAVAAAVGWRPWRGGVLTRAERSDTGRFAWRMQVAGLWGFVNLEADALVVALLLPVSSLGAYAIGAGVAGGLRSALATLLPPLLGPVSTAGADLDVVLPAFEHTQARWIRLVAGPALVSVPLAAAVAATLSQGSGLAAAPVAAALAVGHAVNLGTGVLSYLARVLGRPLLEARYGRLSAVTNLAVTVALTPAFGLVGVCVGTATGQVVGSLWFVRMVRVAVGRPVSSFVQAVPWGAGIVSSAVMTSVAAIVVLVRPGTVPSLSMLGLGAALGCWAYRKVWTRLSVPSQPEPARTPRSPLTS